MGKDKRAEKNKNYSKNVNLIHHSRTLIIVKLKKMPTELDQPTNCSKLIMYSLSP